MALLDKLKSLLGVGERGSKRRDHDGGVTVDRDATDATARSSREAPPPMSSRDRDESIETDVDDGTAVGATEDAESTGDDIGYASDDAAPTSDDIDTASDADDNGTSDADDDPVPGTDDVTAHETDTRSDDGADTAAEVDEAKSVAATIEEAEPDSVDDSSDESDAVVTGTDASGSTGSITREPPEDGAAEPGEAVGPADTDATPTTEKTTDSTPEPTEVESEPVTEIKGIGPAYGERLATAGVESTLALAESDAEELAAETDIAASRIEEWIDRANDR